MTDQKTKSITLYFQAGTSDKVYKAEIVKDSEGFTVNGWNGRRGNTLIQQCKGEGMTYEDAVETYESLVKSKLKKGYHPGKDTVNYTAPSGIKVKPTATHADTVDEFAKLIEMSKTTYMPQLLDVITEDQAQAYLLNPDYLLQTKENGRRQGLTNTVTEVFISNKLGKKVGMPDVILSEATELKRKFELDGEMIGEVYKVYDLFMLDGKNLRELPYIKRFEMAKEMVKDCKYLIPTKTAYTTDEKIKLFKWLKDNNNEGAVFKLKDSLFTAGKGHKTHFKCKFWVMATVMISKINKQRSVEVSMLKNGVEIVSVGNITVKANQDFESIKVGEIWEVKYLYIVAEGGNLYQPELLFERDDQDQPDDVSILKINSVED